MKSVLISIRPKWCELIASGKKTIEVRKTRPNIETPFKCYIYCTKPKMITKKENKKMKLLAGFSLKRAVGITKAKNRISRKTKIPLTRSGRQRKIGKLLGIR